MPTATLAGPPASTAERRVFVADRGDDGIRLDRVLLRRLADRPEISRQAIQRWIAAGGVRIDGLAAARPSRRVRWGDEISLGLPPRPPRRAHAAQEMPLAVRFEDEHLLAVDKPAGLVVHPTAGHRDGTLWNALLFHARGWSAAAGGEVLRPSLVHRLDRGTSGLLLVAKSAAVHAGLQRALRAPTAEKTYLAVVHGRTRRPCGRMAWRIDRDPGDRRRRRALPAGAAGGRDALTLYERLAESAAPLSLLACRLKTGRTHQIRVHLAALGHPIVGDPLYAAPRRQATSRRRIADPELAACCRDLSRPALHAWRLGFVHPVTRRRMTLAAPPPADLGELLRLADLELPEVAVEEGPW